MQTYYTPPFPWQMVVAPGQNRPYYFNPMTNVTQWSAPEPEVVAVPHPANGGGGPAAAGGIPMPDPVADPERYKAWLEVTAHIETGDKNTASFSGLSNAAGNGIKGEIKDSGGLALGDCVDFMAGHCAKGAKCRFYHLGAPADRPPPPRRDDKPRARRDRPRSRSPQRREREFPRRDRDRSPPGRRDRSPPRRDRDRSPPRRRSRSRDRGGSRRGRY